MHLIPLRQQTYITRTYIKRYIFFKTHSLKPVRRLYTGPFILFEHTQLFTLFDKSPLYASR